MSIEVGSGMVWVEVVIVGTLIAFRIDSRSGRGGPLGETWLCVDNIVNAV